MEGGVLPGQQPGTDFLLPHGFHLSGHAGHQHRASALLLKPGAGSGAVAVGDLLAPGGDHGLFAVVGGGGPARGRKIAGDLLPFLGVKDQAVPVAGRHRLLGQVVGRRAEAPGKHQQVAPLFCLVDPVGQPVVVIPDGALALDRDAQSRQLPAEILGVGVEDVPQ